MNFVILAHSFPPGNGPECFCSGRFASALVEAGHTVHVVTVARKEWGVSREVYDVLVDKRVKVTTFVDHEEPKPVWARLRFLTHEVGAANFAGAIATLKSVLKQYEKPILVSRANPIASHIIAWHCRKYAHRWIAHFSDPIPFWGSSRWTFRVKSWIEQRWARRAIRAADGVSLTNQKVSRFYHETYGSDFDSKPMTVTPHVGEPALTSRTPFERETKSAVVVHCGTLTGARGANQMIEAVKTLNEDGVPVEFWEVGDLDVSLAERFSSTPHVRALPNLAPDYGIAVSNVADVVFVPDVATQLPYAPFLPSKFVYQLFYDNPIVALTRPDSTMAEYARTYPGAGIFVADSTNVASLVSALKSALNSTRQYDRKAVRGLFTRRCVGEDFAAFCESL